jgi:hypothetical protein
MAANGFYMTFMPVKLLRPWHSSVVLCSIPLQGYCFETDCSFRELFLWTIRSACPKKSWCSPFVGLDGAFARPPD